MELSKRLARNFEIIHEGAGERLPCENARTSTPRCGHYSSKTSRGTRKGKGEEEKSRMWQMGRDIRDGMGEWEVKRKRGRAAEEGRERERRDRPRPLAAGLTEFELLNCIEEEL